MTLTLKQAADETGLSKPAILKAIKKGRISAKKDDKGRWQIEPVELFRAYPKVNQVNEINDNQLTKGNTKVNSDLQVEVEVLREKSKMQKERIEELSEERDNWKDQANKLLLTYEADKKDQRQTSTQEAQPGKYLLWVLPLFTGLLVLFILLALGFHNT